MFILSSAPEPLLSIGREGRCPFELMLSSSCSEGWCAITLLVLLLTVELAAPHFFCNDHCWTGVFNCFLVILLAGHAFPWAPLFSAFFLGGGGGCNLLCNFQILTLELPNQNMILCFTCKVYTLTHVLCCQWSFRWIFFPSFSTIFCCFNWLMRDCCHSGPSS